MQFSKQSNYYAKYRPSYPSQVFLELLKHVPSTKKALDCGTGSGQAAIRLADHFEDVYATDISSEQLSFAEKRNNVHYSVSPAERTSFQDHSMDIVVVAQAIHWFDLKAFYQEVKRVVKPGGMIAVIGYHRIQTRSEIAKFLMPFFDIVFGLYFSENRSLVEEGYKTIPFPFEEVGYYTYEHKKSWSLEDLSGYLHSWSAVQKYIDEKSEDPTIDVITKLSDRWKIEEEVCFPIFMRLGRV
jgi:SAM-dependent methyltransferase